MWFPLTKIDAKNICVWFIWWAQKSVRKRQPILNSRRKMCPPLLCQRRQLIGRMSRDPCPTPPSMPRSVSDSENLRLLWLVIHKTVWCNVGATLQLEYIWPWAGRELFLRFIQNKTYIFFFILACSPCIHHDFKNLHEIFYNRSSVRTKFMLYRFSCF